MNIVKVSGHACIRSTKEAMALVEHAGEHVHMIAKRVPSFMEIYNTFVLAEGLNNYLHAIKVYDHIADIWHVHNEPSWFVTAIKEISNKPVVLDVHDSYLTRLTPEQDENLRNQGKYPIRIYTDERNNFQLADGLIFVGESFADQIRTEYKLQQPHTVLHSYVPHRLYQYKCYEYQGGLVYEGKIDLTEETQKDDGAQQGFAYSDYEDLAKECHRLGMDFHIYTVRKDEKFQKTYKDIAFIHEPEWFNALLPRLTRHDWGLVGNLNYTREWEVAIPNKMFEYIASCVPVVAINAKACGEFVKEYGVGIEVESIEELCSRWAEHEKCRERLIKVRGEFTMEKHIHKVTDLYGKLLG